VIRNSAFAGVQLEYDRFSRLSVWRWGALTEKYGYDRAGRLSEIRYADDTSTVYAFKDMFSGLVSISFSFSSILEELFSRAKPSLLVTELIVEFRLPFVCSR